METIKLWNYSTYDVNRMKKEADAAHEAFKNSAKQIDGATETRIRENFASGKATNLMEGYTVSIGGIRSNATGEVMTEEEKAQWDKEYAVTVEQPAQKRSHTFDWSRWELRQNHHTDNDAYWGTTENRYVIDGVDFTAEETRQSNDVVRQAMNMMPTQESILHYQDYATMGIAVAMTRQYSSQYLNKEQGEVLDRAVMDWANYIVELETCRLKEEGCFEDASDPYFNKREEITVNGKKSVVTLDSASNQSLIRKIFDTYANLDLNDKDAVNRANSFFYSSMKSASSSSFFAKSLLEDVQGTLSNATAFLRNINSAGIDVKI